MSDAVSRSISHETLGRSRPVRGGKATCSLCDKPHAPGTGYCKEHHAAYMREWRKRERDRIKALEAQVGTWVEPA